MALEKEMADALMTRNPRLRRKIEDLYVTFRGDVGKFSDALRIIRGVFDDAPSTVTETFFKAAIDQVNWRLLAQSIVSYHLDR